MADISINSKGARTGGKKAEEQDERLRSIERKRSDDRSAAAKSRRARQQAADAEAQRQLDALKAEAAAAEAAAAERREAVGKLGAAALSAGGTLAASALKGGKGKGRGKGPSPKTALFIVLAIVVIALLLFLAWPRLQPLLFPEPTVTVATQLEQQEVLGATRAEISNAILGEARQKSELVVWEQDVQVSSEITQSLANLGVFSKTKRMTSFGTGVFTVDMGQVTDASIDVDQGSRDVVLRIPRTQLQYITKDLSRTEFQDTQRGVLGFGDVKLTQEQQNVLERSVEDAMREQLEAPECFEDADAAALLVVYDVYQPLIAAVDDTYTLDVQFAAER